MSIYRMSDEYIKHGRHQLLDRLFIRYALLITILCSAVAVAIRHSMGPREEFHIVTYAIGVPALAAVIIISLRDSWKRGLSHLQKSAEAYRLTVEPGEITCIRVAQPPIVLHSQDIIKVHEYARHGLHLCTSDPRLCIVIPPEIENYEACKLELHAQGLQWKSTV